jgi:hypothetical protein
MDKNCTRHSQVPKLVLQGWCYKHNQQCPLHDVGVAKTTGNAAGSTCVDFSSRGKQLRCIGPHALPFAVWLKERVFRMEDFILHENVVGHPSKLLLTQALGESHFIWDFVIHPSALGYPCRRPRRVALCLSKLKCLELEPIHRSPSVMFGAMVVGTALMYFVDTQQHDVDEHYQQVRAQKRLPDTHTLPRETLSEYQQKLLKQYERVIAQMEKPLLCHLVDVTQRLECPLLLFWQCAVQK